MGTFGWDQMTDWLDTRMGDEGDLWHRALIDPPLLRLVGEVSGLHLLDLACGNGYLSRRFARQGAAVTSVDANASLIERARVREAQEPLDINYHVADLEEPEPTEEFLAGSTWGPWIAEIPLHCVIEAWKVRGT